LASLARIGSAALSTQCVGGEADLIDEQGGVVAGVIGIDVHVEQRKVQSGLFSRPLFYRITIGVNP
jgi:hypothetical protein